MMVQLTAAIFTGLFVMCAALIIAGARVGRLVGVKKRLSRITAGTVQATQPELKKTRKPLM
ncbi:MAG: hypothetical protein P4M02_12610, partial [Clostridia bacterium]|nr:hypothetical protein [Clostridia bacterium]